MTVAMKTLAPTENRTIRLFHESFNLFHLEL